MKLAINGGQKVRERYFPGQNNIGPEEQEAVKRVLDSNTLSGYRGSWSAQFYGGNEIRALEREFAEKFKIAHAIACNSCTSALLIACKAIDLDSNSQVIVTPWSMTCSASIPLAFNSVPIFADIDNSFCLDPQSIEEHITTQTKAIITVDLFGQPCDYDEITKVIDDRDIYIIEDAAQAIGSTYKGRYAGTLGDIGVFSFTQGKILHAGEGGMITTNDNHLAMKCRMIMNHADAVLHGMEEINKIRYGLEDTLFGYNLRMTEITAAIIRCQLKKLKDILNMRRKNAATIADILSDIPAIHSCSTRDQCTNSFYVQSFIWDKLSANGIHRNKFVKAVVAELMPEEGRLDKALLGNGYIAPLYRFPVFKAFAKTRNIKYHKLPVVEKLWKDMFFLSMFEGLPLEKEDFDDINKAFHKVFENISEL